MREEAINKKKRQKKGGILLSAVVVFVLLLTGFLHGQSPAKAEALDDSPSAVSRVLILGKGSPINDQQRKELEKEQKKIEKRREEIRERQKDERVAGSSQDTSPTGTDADSGSSGVGGNTGGTGDPSGDEGKDPEAPAPGGEETGKLPVIYSTLRNGDSYNGPMRGFTVYADDYQGRHINRANFSVYANGEKLYSSGDRYNAHYQMTVLAGTNKVSITVTDSFGVQGTREYAFTGYPDEPSVQRGHAYVTLDLRTIGGGYAFSNYEVPIYDGENLPYVVVRALEANGYTVRYTGNKAYGFYLASITKPGILALKQNCITPPPILAKLEEVNAAYMSYSNNDTLMEKEIYGGSGFIYFHNDWFREDDGMSGVPAQDGDEIVIAFTTYYGYEYNGTWFSGNW